MQHKRLPRTQPDGPGGAEMATPGMSSRCWTSATARSRCASSACPVLLHTPDWGRPLAWCCQTSGASCNEVERCPAHPLTCSFHSACSGLTAEQPALLRYVLNLRARVRLVAPARVEPGPGLMGRPLGAVLAGRPLLTIAFDDMTMAVGQPTRAAR